MTNDIKDIVERLSDGNVELIGVGADHIRLAIIDAKKALTTLSEDNAAMKLEIERLKKSEACYGKDCPEGMVQVEFVGCSPANRNGEYGWKPEKSAFIELWVDGKRFRIDAGDVRKQGDDFRRGIKLNYPIGMEVDVHSANALDISTTRQALKDNPNA